MNEIIYTQYELAGLSDSELLEILAKSWGIDNGKFEVWGQLPALENPFGFLQNPRLVKNGKRLYYPLQGEEREPCRFYINPRDANKLGSKTMMRFIRCELELSSESERVKHQNPFSLCMKQDTGEILQSLPKEIPEEILVDPLAKEERSQFISQSIYDFYLGKEIDSINKEIEKRKETLEKEFFEQEQKINHLLFKNREILQESETEKNKLEQTIKSLTNEHEKLNDFIRELNKDKEFKEQEIIQLIHQYTQMERDMNNKINRLKKYISEKAMFLKTFEFIDEEDLNLFLTDSKPREKHVNGFLFNEFFKGDYQAAVSYIQAYLVNKDILYPRHIIENYLTLLRTKDLIILAGDSGSGKTNLVKSFAEAVGGRSVIIPVKPNWTSSEDLLGYYNPLEKKFLSTPFWKPLLKQNKTQKYLISSA